MERKDNEGLYALELYGSVTRANCLAKLNMFALFSSSGKDPTDQLHSFLVYPARVFNKNDKCLIYVALE